MQLPSITRKAVEWFIKHLPEHGDTYGSRSIKELGKRRVEYLGFTILLMMDQARQEDKEEITRLRIDAEALTTSFMFAYDATRKRAEEYLDAMTAIPAPLDRLGTTLKIKAQWLNQIDKWVKNAFKAGTET